MAVSILGN
ncbi:hypothetical protein F383_09369 [Gossypium arboreum]|uniref:Uncharacterized protein n=1 Tax=Gossypium arboreum TaxID=29729 RepID=A0A0B0ME69_GOSAR|nr:hypothetical protein F383_36991 [Gossypium arboreum]KHG25564.1 hypothetical protein F383_09369 [Gossypium arboreum]